MAHNGHGQSLARLVFFCAANRDIRARFAILFDRTRKGIEVAAGAERLDQFGYYLFVKKVADSGKFVMPPADAIDSAMRADLWKVLTYFAVDATQQEVEEAILEESRRRANMKK